VGEGLLGFRTFAHGMRFRCLLIAEGNGGRGTGSGSLAIGVTNFRSLNGGVFFSWRNKEKGDDCHKGGELCTLNGEGCAKAAARMRQRKGGVDGPSIVWGGGESNVWHWGGRDQEGKSVEDGGFRPETSGEKKERREVYDGGEGISGFGKSSTTG